MSQPNLLEENDYNKGFDFSLWKKLIGFGKRHKKHFVLLLVCDVFIAIGDTTFPLMTRYAIDTFVSNKDMSTFPLFIALFVGLIFFQAFNIFQFIYHAGKIETGIVHDVREKGFQKLQELSFSYYDNTPVGWIMARMTGDAQKIGDIIAWGMVDLVWAVSFIIIVVIVMFNTNVQLTLITLSTLPVLLIISFFIQKKLLKGHRDARKINSKITGAFNEGINGAKTTKTLIREQKNYDDFSTLTKGMYKANMRVALVSSIYFPIVFSLGSVTIALLLSLGGIKVALGGVSIATLTMFFAYANQMFEPINNMARLFSEMQSAQASGERTMTLLETQPDVVDSKELIAVYGDLNNPKKENWPTIAGDIEFTNVSFSYKTGEKVLNNFNLSIRAGEKIALVGETGSGKSTIVNLICRFYEPTQGTIFIDGVDYKERTQSWLHANLGYVLQSPHLFSGTIKENIRYGNLEATYADIERAAKQVGAQSFIMKLEKGYDTDVGEGGNRLSSGEKQLISFARAIVGNPKIFVLDEATSSIDTETEQVIQNAITEVLSGRTSFIVAHRLSTIRFCDRILVIKEGNVVESGNHKELIAKKGTYYHLYTNQFKQEAENRLIQGYTV